jgi:hypothetical protein
MPSRKAIDNLYELAIWPLSRRLDNFRLTFLRLAHGAREKEMN